MRFDLRHRALRTAFLAALVAGGAPALAAEPTSPPAGHADPGQQKGSAQARPARATKPSVAAPIAAAHAPVVAHAEKTAGATAVAPAATIPTTPPPSTGSRVQARRGRGAF